MQCPGNTHSGQAPVNTPCGIAVQPVPNPHLPGPNGQHDPTGEAGVGRINGKICRHISNVSPVVESHGLSVHFRGSQAEQTLLLSTSILWPNPQVCVPKPNRPRNGRVIGSRV